MWIFSKYGFFSIVKKHDGYHVRARSRHDLELLKMAVVENFSRQIPAEIYSPDEFAAELNIINTLSGDYCSRIVTDSKAIVDGIFETLGESIDYDNFKNAIARNDFQKDKLGLLARIWELCFDYQSTVLRLTKARLGHLVDYATQRLEAVRSDCPDCEGEGKTWVGNVGGSDRFAICETCEGSGTIETDRVDIDREANRPATVTDVLTQAKESLEIGGLEIGATDASNEDEKRATEPENEQNEWDDEGSVYCVVCGDFCKHLTLAGADPSQDWYCSPQCARESQGEVKQAKTKEANN